MKLKIAQQEKGKLIEQLRVAVTAKDFSQEKVDKINKAIDQKNAEIDLIHKENNDFASSFESNTSPKHEIRDLKTGKFVPQGSHEELEDFVRRDLLGGSTDGVSRGPRTFKRPADFGHH